jgi:hypothetical protein
MLACLSLGSNQSAYAQNPPGKWYLGVEFQAYPAGIIPGITGEYQWSETSSLVFRVGANLADRQDFSGLNDDETGWGPGGTVGYRYQFKNTGWYLGARTDFWWMKIDWQDADEVPASGTTRIGVLQPTLEGGYCWNRELWKFGVGTAQGFEINVISRGEDVGQGFISLIQLFAVRKLGDS